MIRFRRILSILRRRKPGMIRTPPSPLRLASDLREATWGYLQSVLSNLHEPEYYREYGRRHLARFLAGSD